MRNTKNWLRTAHGNGADAIERVEVPPIDEQGSFPPNNGTDTALVPRTPDGRVTKGNRIAKGRRPALARLGVEVPDTADPRYKSALKQAKAYCDVRRRELATLCNGTLGAGPSAMLASSALAMAASRYVYALAAEQGSAVLFLQAAKLADSARQQEISAEALALRAAQASVESPEDMVRRERLNTAKRSQ